MTSSHGTSVSGTFMTHSVSSFLGDQTCVQLEMNEWFAPPGISQAVKCRSVLRWNSGSKRWTEFKGENASCWRSAAPLTQVQLPVCMTAEMKNTCHFIPNGILHFTPGGVRPSAEQRETHTTCSDLWMDELLSLSIWTQSRPLLAPLSVWETTNNVLQYVFWKHCSSSIELSCLLFWTIFMRTDWMWTEFKFTAQTIDSLSDF